MAAACRGGRVALCPDPTSMSRESGRETTGGRKTAETAVKRSRPLKTGRAVPADDGAGAAGRHSA